MSLSDKKDNQFTSLIQSRPGTEFITKVMDDMQKRPGADPNQAKRDIKPLPRLNTTPIIEDQPLPTKKPTGITSIGVVLDGGYIGNQVLNSGFRRINLKIDFPNKCFWLEIETIKQSQYLKYRVQIYFDDLSILDLNSDANILQLEADAYKTYKSVPDPSTGTFRWDDEATLSDVIDWNRQMIKLSISLARDVTDRGLADRLDIMERIAGNIKLFKVDGQPYQRTIDHTLDDVIPVVHSKPRIYGPTLIKEQPENISKKEEYTQNQPEEKIFEEVFKPSDIAEMSRIENNELSKHDLTRKTA